MFFRFDSFTLVWVEVLLCEYRFRSGLKNILNFSCTRVLIHTGANEIFTQRCYIHNHSRDGTLFECWTRKILREKNSVSVFTLGFASCEYWHLFLVPQDFARSALKTRAITSVVIYSMYLWRVLDAVVSRVEKWVQKCLGRHCPRLCTNPVAT